MASSDILSGRHKQKSMKQLVQRRLSKLMGHVQTIGVSISFMWDNGLALSKFNMYTLQGFIQDFRMGGGGGVGKG